MGQMNKKWYRVIGINYGNNFVCSQNIEFDPYEENPAFALAKVTKLRPSDFNVVLIVNNDLVLTHIEGEHMICSLSKHRNDKR